MMRKLIPKNWKFEVKNSSIFLFFFVKMSPISHIVSQTLSSRLSIQTFWFVVNIDRGFDKNKLEKNRTVSKKRRS